MAINYFLNAKQLREAWKLLNAVYRRWGGRKGIEKAKYNNRAHEEIIRRNILESKKAGKPVRQKDLQELKHIRFERKFLDDVERDHQAVGYHLRNIRNAHYYQRKGYTQKHRTEDDLGTDRYVYKSRENMHKDLRKWYSRSQSENYRKANIYLSLIHISEPTRPY